MVLASCRPIVKFESGTTGPGRGIELGDWRSFADQSIRQGPQRIAPNRKSDGYFRAPQRDGRIGAFCRLSSQDLGSRGDSEECLGHWVQFTRTDDTPEAKAACIARLQRMSDSEFQRQGRAAAFMAGRSQRETWCVQLEECRAEWRRRHPEPQPHSVPPALE